MIMRYAINSSLDAKNVSYDITNILKFIKLLIDVFNLDR